MNNNMSDEDNDKYLAEWTPSRENLKELFDFEIEDPDFDNQRIEVGVWLNESGGEEYGTLKINETYSLSIVENFGGEGQGDQYWFVFSVNKSGEPESYWKVPGWYQSYNGGEYELSNLYEVEGREVTVKRWFAKNK